MVIHLTKIMTNCLFNLIYVLSKLKWGLQPLLLTNADLAIKIPEILHVFIRWIGEKAQLFVFSLFIEKVVINLHTIY